MVCIYVVGYTLHMWRCLMCSNVSLSASVGKLNIHAITKWLHTHAHTPWHTVLTHNFICSCTMLCCVGCHNFVHAWSSVLINFYFHMFPFLTCVVHSCLNNSLCGGCLLGNVWSYCNAAAMVYILWCIYDICFPLCLPFGRLIIFCPLIPFDRPHVDTQCDTTFWSAVKQHCSY